MRNDLKSWRSSILGYKKKAEAIKNDENPSDVLNLMGFIMGLLLCFRIHKQLHRINGYTIFENLESKMRSCAASRTS